MALLYWAMSFVEWRCIHCRNVVGWGDACVVEEDGRLVGFKCGCDHD